MRHYILKSLTACVLGTVSLVACGSGGSGSMEGISGDDSLNQNAEENFAVDISGPCGWIALSEIAAVTGDNVRVTHPFDANYPGCVYGMRDNALNSISSSIPPDARLYEDNKSGYVPQSISGLGTKAYCIDIEPLGGIPGGSRVNTLLTNGSLYQIYGTYPCDALSELARKAVGRIPT